jgi:triacylglycerol lipase
MTGTSVKTKPDWPTVLLMAQLAQAIYRTEPQARALGDAQGLQLERFDWHEQGHTQAGVWSDADRLIIAFRGSDQPADWRNNLDLGRLPHRWGKVHGGFARALGRIESELLAFVAAQQAMQPRTLWLTGHSLGGALAMLMAAKLVMARLDVHAVHTFGQPALGNRDFLQRYNRALQARTYRVVNQTDPVVFSLNPLYRHAGTLLQLTEPGQCQIGQANEVQPARRRTSRRKAVRFPDHAIAAYIRMINSMLC